MSEEKLNEYMPEAAPEAVPETAPEAAPVPPKDIPFKDFVNFFDLKQKKGITATAILCYFCAGLTILVSLIGGQPLGSIDGIILLALALGLHLTKRLGFGIAILVVAVIEFLVALIAAGLPNGWLWVVAGALAVVYTYKARKNYKDFQETGALPR